MVTQCSICDEWFPETKKCSSGICPECIKKQEDQKLKEIAELYGIPYPGGDDENKR